MYVLRKNDNFTTQTVKTITVTVTMKVTGKKMVEMTMISETRSLDQPDHASVTARAGAGTVYASAQESFA